MKHTILRFLLPDRLHKAVQGNDLRHVRNLIAKGADVNAPDKAGLTPLFYAADKGSVEAAQLLLDGGADINQVAPQGAMPLHSALFRQHTSLALFFIDNGADISHPTLPGVTPLHIAALGGMASVLRRLLDRGADVHALTAKGQSPLLFALLGLASRKTDDPACLRLLFAAGADPRIGELPLHDILAHLPREAVGVLREELEALVRRTDEAALHRYCTHLLDTLIGKAVSPLLGDLTPSDDAELADWWYGKPVTVPFWDDRQIRVAYIFVPTEDTNFITEADAAVTNFLRLTREDRLALTPLLEANCRLVCENAGADAAALDSAFAANGALSLWDAVTCPALIQVHRRHRRDKDIYLVMDMECDWEREGGLQFVFRQGRQITRVCQQDGWLTDADAFDLQDRDDKLLAAFAANRPTR